MVGIPKGVPKQYRYSGTLLNGHPLTADIHHNYITDISELSPSLQINMPWPYLGNACKSSQIWPRQEKTGPLESELYMLYMGQEKIEHLKE